MDIYGFGYTLLSNKGTTCHVAIVNYNSKRVLIICLSVCLSLDNWSKHYPISFIFHTRVKVLLRRKPNENRQYPIQK